MIMWVWFNHVGVVNYVGVAMAVQVCFASYSPVYKVNLSAAELNRTTQNCFHLTGDETSVLETLEEDTT